LRVAGRPKATVRLCVKRDLLDLTLVSKETY
jgi:hypothetical protein